MYVTGGRMHLEERLFGDNSLLLTRPYQSIDHRHKFDSNPAWNGDGKVGQKCSRTPPIDYQKNMGAIGP